MRYCKGEEERREKERRKGGKRRGEEEEKGEEDWRMEDKQTWRPGLKPAPLYVHFAACNL